MELTNCIYRFLNDNDEIIYIGKAKNLKNRFQEHNHLPKECYEECKKIEYTIFRTEDDMDLAERYYIPKIKPKYNDMMKDRDITLSIVTFDSVIWHTFEKYYDMKQLYSTLYNHVFNKEHKGKTMEQIFSEFWSNVDGRD